MLIQERFSAVPQAPRLRHFEWLIGLTLAIASCAPAVTNGSGEPPPGPRLIVVSIDGLRPDAIDLSRARTLQRLSEEGASARRALTILPSFTLPSHTSMLTGLDVPGHGVTWNDDRFSSLGPIDVPTALEMARAEGCTTAAFFSKRKMRLLDRPGSLDRAHIPADEHYHFAARMTHEVETFLRFAAADVVFIHLSDVDLAGHVFGWMGPPYRLAVREADAALERMLRAVERQVGDATVIVTSDHGGSGRTHGTASAEDREIPWIAWGRGVRPGVVEREVMTYDTAATMLYLLGISVPEGWDGRPVREAFTSAPDRPVCRS